MTDAANDMASTRKKDLFELVLFSASLVLIILFSYLNIYSLPLGTTSADGAVQNASSLYGMNIEIGGVMQSLSENEFLLTDSGTTTSIHGIWLGEGDLPLNGTMVAASGLIVPSQSGPVLRCDGMSVLGASDVIFDNPWSLPSLRLLTVVLLWFIVTTVATGLLSLVHLLMPKRIPGDRMRALGEVGFVAGLAMTACLILFLLVESGQGGGIGIPTAALVTSFLFMSASAVMRMSKRGEVSEISDALPIVAALVTVIGIFMIAIQQQLFSSDILGSTLAIYLHGFQLVAVVGTAGVVLLGVYLAERKYYALSIRGMLRLGKDEVK